MSWSNPETIAKVEAVKDESVADASAIDEERERAERDIRRRMNSADPSLRMQGRLMMAALPVLFELREPRELDRLVAEIIGTIDALACLYASVLLIPPTEESLLSMLDGRFQETFKTTIRHGAHLKAAKKAG
jgi:hypothetical protein